MSTNQEIITIANVTIDVIRKDIKNMHLAVYPPSGRIRLAAPEKTDFEVLRLFAISKLAWIKKHIKNFNNQARETQRDYVSGESHFINGKRVLLNVIPCNSKTRIEYDGSKNIKLFTKPNTSKEAKGSAMKEWYRKELKKQIPELINKWEPIIGVKANAWGVKQMRTKWGSCNTDTKKIWLNLELAKKPTICLEYILVHELVHLHERNHNEQFVKHMDEFMPKWRLHRDELNRLPVAHNDWGY